MPKGVFGTGLIRGLWGEAIMRIGTLVATCALMFSSAVAATPPAVVELEPLAGSTTCGAGRIIDSGNVLGSCLPGGNVIWRHGVIAGQLEPAVGYDAFGVTAINSRGQAVGVGSSGTTFHALFWNGGPPIQLAELPNSPDTEALALNDRGQAVGFSAYYQPPRAGVGAVLWDSDGVHQLEGLPPGPGIDEWSEARDINSSGQVIGSSATGTGEWAVLWDGGRLVVLPTLGGASEASAINSRGQVVGVSAAGPGEFRAVLWENGSVIDLGLLPGDSFSDATDINDRGQIVGVSGTPFPYLRAVVWEGGKIRALETLPDYPWCIAESVNARGEAVGECWSTNDPSRRKAVLWNLP